MLGDIPVLGFFFRNTTKQVQKSNIIIALTPYVIDDMDDLRRVAEKKMRERREFIERFSAVEDKAQLEGDIDYRRKRGMLEEINRSAREIDDEEAALRRHPRARPAGRVDPHRAARPAAGPPRPSEPGSSRRHRPAPASPTLQRARRPRPPAAGPGSGPAGGPRATAGRPNGAGAIPVAAQHGSSNRMVQRRLGEILVASERACRPTWSSRRWPPRRRRAGASARSW